MKEAADIIGLYDRHALDWDADRGRTKPGTAPFEKPWLDRFTALLPEGGSILDLGCGSGDPLARYLIDAGFDLTGVDASRQLIEICRSKFPEHAWTTADMRRLDLGKTFDGVLVWHSLFHLTPADQKAMFAVFERHTHAGSALIFTAGSEANESLGQWRGEPLYHASLDDGSYRSLLEAQGFEVVAHQADDAECGHATVYLARRR